MNITPDVTFHPFEIAFCGFSNSGKTTLISRLISLFSKSYSVGYYKHGCHRFDIDREGKDSFVVSQSGATTVMLSDPERHALVSNAGSDPLLEKTGLLHADFLLVEGLKELPLPKLVVVDRDHRILDLLGKKTLKNVIALIAPDPASIPDAYGLPVFHRDRTEEIAEFILTFFHGMVSNRQLFGLVLAGGESKRMGEDKALLTYHTEVQIEHTAAMLLKHCKEAYLSCRYDQQNSYSKYGIPLVPDSYLGIGPLGGLLSAQKRFPEASWLVTACDLPFLDHTLLGELVVERNPFSFATAYHHAGRKPEPLCTIYEPKSRLPLIFRHATGNNSLRSFLEDSRIHYLSIKDPRSLHNINTPEERKQVIESLSMRGKTQ